MYSSLENVFRTGALRQQGRARVIKKERDFMIWLKSIGIGLIAVLIFVILAAAGSVLLGHLYPTSMFGFSLRLAWLILMAVFLLGFGWELWRLEHK